MLRRLANRCRCATEADAALARWVWDPDWIKQAEPAAAASIGVDLCGLMANAGTAAFDVCRRLYPDARKWAILVGPGNNGGDGYVVARHAKACGAEVVVLTMPTTRALPVEAEDAKASWLACGGTCVTIDGTFDLRKIQPSLLIDALLGTGSAGAPRGLYADVIRQANALPACIPRIAIDIPTGLDARTGQVPGDCFAANHTISFLALKPGLLTGQARAYTGDLHFDSIGVREFMQRPEQQKAAFARRLGHEDLASWLAAPRHPCSHKGSHGKVLLIGGEPGMGGAIMMAAEASLRSGVGLVRVITAAEHVAPLLSRCPEVMVTGANFYRGEDAEVSVLTDLREALRWCTTIVFGPGMGSEGLPLSHWILTELLSHPGDYDLGKKIVVVDAGGLKVWKQHHTQLAPQAVERGRFVVTPHPGEAAALLGCSIAEVERDRYAAASAITQALGGVCLLKGAGTVVHRGVTMHAETATDPPCSIIDAGNAGMAVGGMGDALSGIIASMSAQSAVTHGDVYESACLGALVHSVAADCAVATRGGMRGLRVTELLEHISHCVNP